MQFPPARRETRRGTPVPTPRRVRAVHRAALAVVLAVAVQGCGLTGDFGRPKHGTVLLNQAFYDVTDHLMAGGRPSLYNLTDDEIRMRKTAFRLRTEVREPLPAALIPYNEGGYANHLTATRRINGPSRMAAIDDQLNADHEALTRFAQAARKVLLADRRRLMALADGGPAYSRNDADNAVNRVEENYHFMEGTFGDLDNRVAAFRRAIDRSKLETPAADAGPVEGSLNHLYERSLALRYEVDQFHLASAQPMPPPPPGPAGAPPMPLTPPYTAKTADARPAR